MLFDLEMGLEVMQYGLLGKIYDPFLCAKSVGKFGPLLKLKHA